MSGIGLNGVSDKILELGNQLIGNTSETQTSGQAEQTGAIDGVGGIPISVMGTDSLFNPFYTIRYSEFGQGTTATTAGSYALDRHNIKYEKASLVNDILDKAREIVQLKNETVQNPTAVVIRDWANAQAEKGKDHKGPLYPYPYSMNDFLWCKWYGKIPNNRLITLRRYPVPVEDNLQVHQEKLPLVPVAQAVTWWGGDTGNSISKLLSMTYGFNWKDYPGEGQDNIQDVIGNEIKLEDLLDSIGIKKDSAARNAIIAAFGNLSGGDPFTMSGHDKTLQENQKDQWESGAYSNRVRGPVNVITQTKQRERGYTWAQDITIDFEYSLRSYGTLNPKIAMLDILSNFLSLTHNRATFWGGGYRYFQQTGPLLPGMNTDALEKGDYANALKEIMGLVTNMTQGGSADLAKFFSGMSNDVADSASIGEAAKKIAEGFASSRVGQNLIASKLGPMHQTPLVMRALADGRAVGEWHLMVGNPMDPLAVIGNLCMSTTTVSFSDELGADDFPVSMKFSVTLIHGRPRAKQDIESIFNHGGGDLSFTALQPPSSAANSFGEYNNRRLVGTIGTTSGVDNTAMALAKDLGSSAASLAAANDGMAAINKRDLAEATNLGNYYRQPVSSKYGSGFGKSPILTDYFTKLYTKD